MWMNDTGKTSFKNAVVELIYAVNYINQQKCITQPSLSKKAEEAGKVGTVEKPALSPSLVSGTDALSSVCATI